MIHNPEESHPMESQGGNFQPQIFRIQEKKQPPVPWIPRGKWLRKFGAIIKVAANVAEHVEGLPLQWCMEFVDA